MFIYLFNYSSWVRKKWIYTPFLLENMVYLTPLPSGRGWSVWYTPSGGGEFALPLLPPGWRIWSNPLWGWRIWSTLHLDVENLV